MTRMTGPDCVVMCNLINTHTHTHRWDRGRGWRRTKERKIGTGTGRGRGWRPVDEHRVGTEMGAGTETRAVAGIMGTGTGTGRVVERRKSARNRPRVVDAMNVGNRKKRRQGSIGSVAIDQHSLENSKESGGKHKVPRAKVRTVQLSIRENVCSLARLSEVFIE